MDRLTDEFLVDPARFDGPVLVSGAGGCIGGWTVAVLARSGVPVVASDLKDDRRRPGLVMGEAAAAALTWESIDVTDGKRVADVVAKHGVRSIIHLAGMQVPFCKAAPALGARVNVEGTINILEAARHAGIRRLAYASSTAALGMPPGGAHLSTLYGAYKLANEYTAKMYWIDWQVPSIGIRPNVVYGVGRDQGMSSMFTQGVAHAVRGEAFEVPYAGPVSWLYAGEAAAAFIAAVSKDGEGAPVFNLNGACQSVEDGLVQLSAIAPDHKITATGQPIPVPPDLDDGPLRSLVGDYPSVPPAEGIRATWEAFTALEEMGRLHPAAPT